MEPTSKTVDRLIQEYKINTDSTKLVKTKKNKVSKSTRIFKLDRAAPPTFIIDTPMAREIACYPHLVGESLEQRSRKAAAEALPAILELSGVTGKRGGCEIVFEQILRAAPGYKLQDAAPKVLGNSYRTVYLRPRYTHRSYRDHDGTIQREIEIVHQEFSQFPKGKKIALIMQDTVASGRSGEISINATLKHCQESSCRIDKWILYGFISEYGLDILHRIAKENDISMYAFAMGNLTTLSTNNYDMPLYGVDEAHWQKTHTIRKIGSIIDRTSLKEYVPCFVPGSDQPGDWSARQTKLFNGASYEPGDIIGHLNNSTRLIKSLTEIGGFEPWQQRIAEKELDFLQKALRKESTRRTA
ncbi:hypothetical protein MUP07_10710 [Candidatus Bathyarchaeota archaeon]|nr:hypothetical protein [Candidatus Bathyarchaeota archaeon]